MKARNKLNAGHINGILIFAGLIALITRSWTSFIVAVVALLVTSILSSDIRFSLRE